MAARAQTSERYALSASETASLRRLSRGAEASLEEVRAEIARARAQNAHALKAYCSQRRSRQMPLPSASPPDLAPLADAERGFRDSWEDILAALLGLKGPAGKVTPRIREDLQRRQKRWEEARLAFDGELCCPPPGLCGSEA